jgi:hypothetical protein
MENKVEKLREKLKRRAETSNTAAPTGTTEAPSEESRRNIMDEVEAIRAEITEMQTARADELEGLRVRVAEAKGRVGHLQGEKEAAESGADLARRLVVGVEARLQDVVRGREQEQAELVEERYRLEQDLDEQAKQLASYEHIRRIHRQLEGLRASQGYDSGPHESSVRQSPENVVEEEVVQAPVTDLTLATTIETPLAAVARPEEQAAFELDGTEQAVETHRKLLAEQAASSKNRVVMLQSQIEQAHAVAEAAIVKCKADHLAEMQQTEEEHRSELEIATTASASKLNELTSLARTKTCNLEEQYSRGVEEIQQETAALEAEYATRAAALEAEIERVQTHAELARREAAFRGSVWLTVRRSAPVDRDLVISTIADAIDVDVSRIRWVSSDAFAEVPAPSFAQKDPMLTLKDGAREDSNLTASASAASPKHDVLCLPSPVPVSPRPPHEIAPLHTVRSLRNKRVHDACTRVAPVLPPITELPGRDTIQSEGGSGTAQNNERIGTVGAVGPFLEQPTTLTNRPDLSVASISDVRRPADIDNVAKASDHRVLQLEFLENPKDQDPSASSLNAAVRLVDAVKLGAVSIEPLAAIRAIAARGETHLRANKFSGAGETATLVARGVRNVSGWPLVVTAFLNRDPFVLKFVASDSEAGFEFFLHLVEEDVEALAPGSSAATRPSQLVEAIAPLLMIIDRDGRLMLIAAQTVESPPTQINCIDPLLCETGQLSSEQRRQRRGLVHRAPPMVTVASPPLTPPPKAPKSKDALLALTSGPSASHETMIEASDWRLVREEVLELSETFAIISLERSSQSSVPGQVRITLQEAGRCRPFQFLLDAGAPRRQRFFAEHCEFPRLSLVLVVTETVTPPLLRVRVLPASGAPEFSPVDVCFSTDDWRPGDVNSFATTSPQQIARLLEFLLHAPAGARAAVEGTGASAVLESKGHDCTAIGPYGKRGVGRVAFTQGLVLHAAVPWRSSATVFASSRGATGDPKDATIEASTDGAVAERTMDMRSVACRLRRETPGNPRSTWTLLAQCGRNVPSEFGDGLLCVIRVHHRLDPFGSFLVTAYQVGVRLEWELLIAAEEAVAKLGLNLPRGGPCGRPHPPSPEVLAPLLLKACHFTRIGEQCALTLVPQGGNAATAQVRILVSPTESCVPVSVVSKTTEEGAVTSSQTRALANVEMAQLALADLDRTCCDVAMTGTAGHDRTPCLGLFPIGGRFVNLQRCGTWETTEAVGETLYTKICRFGDLDFVVSLDACGGRSGSSAGSSRGHRLSIYHPPTCTCFELSMPSRDAPCPEKVCAVTAKLEGKTFFLVLAEAAFPHSLQAMVRESRGQDFKCTVRDEDIFALFPRSHRQLMQQCVEELFKQGAISEQGGRLKVAPPVFAEFALGAHIPDLGNHSEVPVIKAMIPACSPCGGSCPDEVGREQLTSVLCSADFEVDSQRLRLVLTRVEGTGSFTLGVGPDGDASSAHLIHVTASENVGVHSEVRDIAGVRLLVLLLLDVAPRALRVAIVEPVARHVYQFVVLDSSSASQATAEPTSEPARELLLSTYLENFSSVGPNFAPGATTSTPALRGSEPKPTLSQHQIIHRGVRKLPSGQPVVLSIVREQACSCVTRFRILMYHPVSGRETYLFLANPLLDEVLAQVGLEASRMASVQDVDAKSQQLAALILQNIYVHPDGAEMEIRPNHSSSNK